MDINSFKYCVCFSSIKKLWFPRKDILWQQKFNSINFDKKYFFLIKQKQIKNSKQIWMKPSLKKRNNKSAWVNIFSELLLTEKFQHYFWMNATSYIYFYTLITYTLCITYAHMIQHALITKSYIDFYNSLQTFFFLLNIIWLSHSQLQSNSQRSLTPCHFQAPLILC